MPNGHGGIPKYKFVPITAGAFVLSVYIKNRTGNTIPIVTGYIFAILTSLTFAWDRFTHDASEYDWGYTTEEEKKAAIGKFRIAFICYGLIAIVVSSLIFFYEDFSRFLQ
ncbi:MAG TPA: hypothetical protein PLN69_05850 [bacterium]|nr:hypothetical protein [bacterium]